MSDKKYPNMDTICRMCLKEDGGTVSIFPSSQAKDEKHSHISIPMRIMSCVALEVQAHDGMPPKICSTCRYQLEKCYLFRKQSQAADAKLRKHIRLLSVGKTSKVFLKNPHDDDDDDEAEFQDSLDFINEMEEKTKEEEKLRFEVYKEEMQVQKDAEISALRQALKDECKDEVRLEIEERVRAEVKKEMQKEFDEILLPKIKEDCLKECRDSLQEEVREECRQIEMTALLSDLHDFLEEKQTWRRQEKKQNNAQINKSKCAPSSKQEYNDEGPSTNEVRYSPIHFIEIDKSKVSSIPVHNQAKPVLSTKSAIKKELILDDNPPDTTTTNVINDDEDDGDSDKYLIYDTDEGFEFQKRSELSNDNTEEEEGYMPESSQHYDSGEENTMTNDIAPKATTTLARTTSYRIEDAENGDITFLKKSSDSHSPSLANAGNSVGQLQNDSNIVILNFPNDLEGDDDHLELLEYNEDFENKVIKPVVESGPAPKRFRSSEQNVSSPNSQQFTTTTTTSSTIETTTVLAKTFVNTVQQRTTDTPKLFKCHSCPMVFSTNSSLERHLRTHRKGEETGVSFQCPECQVVVSCASALRRHMYIHCAEKPFICEECGKSFVQREILKRHMQIHTGIKPYKCEHCDRAFAQRINLKQHINRHHSEEPHIQQHSCHLCPKRFNHASGLSRHLASHSGVAFQCTECDRTFGDRSSIKRHIVNKHGKGAIAKTDNS